MDKIFCLSVCSSVCLFGEGKIKGFRGICALRVPFSSFSFLGFGEKLLFVFELYQKEFSEKLRRDVEYHISIIVGKKPGGSISRRNRDFREVFGFFFQGSVLFAGIQTGKELGYIACLKEKLCNFSSICGLVLRTTETEVPLCDKQLSFNHYQNYRAVPSAHVAESTGRRSRPIRLRKQIFLSIVRICSPWVTCKRSWN